jgi:hypothetical protein
MATLRLRHSERLRTPKKTRIIASINAGRRPSSEALAKRTAVRLETGLGVAKELRRVVTETTDCETVGD